MRLPCFPAGLIATALAVFPITACSSFRSLTPVPKPIATVVETDEPIVGHDAPISRALPARTQLTHGSLRLPGALLNNRGSVRAVVQPLSFGERLPAWTDTAIAVQVIGSSKSVGPTTPSGAAGILYNASRGLFRLEASVFPYLTAPSVEAEDISPILSDQKLLSDLVTATLERLGSRANLASFDNDGPDGQPMSGDDDGLVDLVIVMTESDSTSVSARLPVNIKLTAGSDRGLRLYIREANVLALPRSQLEDVASLQLQTAALILGAMGLEYDEIFFPIHTNQPVSTLARVRLGWLPAIWAGRSGTYLIQEGRAVVVPIVDVDDNRGLWLIELSNGQAYLTRVARKSNGHFSTVDLKVIRRDDNGVVLPLTQGDGPEGPRAQIAWQASGDLQMELTLSPSQLY